MRGDSPCPAILPTNHKFDSSFFMLTSASYRGDRLFLCLVTKAALERANGDERSLRSLTKALLEKDRDEYRYGDVGCEHCHAREEA